LFLLFLKFFRSGITFNQTWEDFDVDQKILHLDGNDILLAITSGGCNILNACLLGPKKIFAIDSNTAQNHLLRLKIASIKTLNYSEFWGFFGEGKTAQYRDLYFLSWPAYKLMQNLPKKPQPARGRMNK